jgi:predicted nucleic acid-binding protein
MILLDTNVVSALRRPGRHPQVVAWLRGRDADSVRLSALTVGELVRGVELESRRDPVAGRALRGWVDRTLSLYADRVLPFTPRAAAIWGRLSAGIGHDGVDLQIAATALEHGLSVATRNVADFARTGVAVVNPFEAPLP